METDSPASMSEAGAPVPPLHTDDAVGATTDGTAPSLETAPSPTSTDANATRMITSPTGPTAAARPLRDTLTRVGEKAQSLTTQLCDSSVVLNFGIRTMEKLVSPATALTKHTWSSYGGPLIDSLDDRIIKMRTTDASPQQAPAQASLSPSSSGVGVEAGLSPASPSLSHDDGSGSGAGATERRVYSTYWQHVQHRFAQSRWYSHVNDILGQNKLLQTLNQRLVRPAEMFYSTATEVFLSDGDTYTHFIDALKQQMGPAWDDRLVQPAAAFYNTARAVSVVVGTGKFFGGALQLGRQRIQHTIHHAIDDLKDKWEQVLHITDGALDAYLPDHSPVVGPTVASLSNVAPMEEEEARETEGQGGEEPEDRLTTDTGGDSAQGDGDQTLIDTSSSDTLDTLDTEHKRPTSKSVEALYNKVRERVQQRIPLVRELPSQLKTRLLQTSWFHTVDAILRENVMVQMMQQQMMQVMNKALRPAEHFYNTAVHVLREGMAVHATAEQFVTLLRGKMGTAWDDRLKQPAVAFFNSAAEVMSTNGQQQQQQQ